MNSSSCRHSVWPVPCVFFFQCVFLVSDKKSGIHRFVGLCLDLQFDSIHQHVCFCANIMLFLLWWLFSTTWIFEWWCLQPFFVLAIMDFGFSYRAANFPSKVCEELYWNFDEDYIDSIYILNQFVYCFGFILLSSLGFLPLNSEE